MTIEWNDVLSRIQTLERQTEQLQEELSIKCKTVEEELNALADSVRKAAEASISSARRMAMLVVGHPKDQRENTLVTIRRNLEDALKQAGQNHERGRAWLDKQMQGIRALVAEIESSGGGTGGNA
jgi:chromosome segregation ATPase